MRVLFLAAMFFGGASRAFALEQCSFPNWESLVERSDEKSVEIKILDLNKEALKRSQSIAALSPTSILNGEVVKGSERIGDGELEASYLFVWENQKKRDARVAVFSESINSVDAIKDEKRAKTRVDLALALQRLQQIAEEKEAFQESRDTYLRLGKKIRALPVLSPEQQLTLSIFQLAADESSTKMASLSAEESQYRRTIERATQCSAAVVNFKLSLPKNLKMDAGESGTSPAEKVLASEARVSLAERESANAETIRNIEFGPIARLGRDDKDTRFSAGIAVSLPLTEGRRSYQIAEAQAVSKAKEAEIDYRMSLLSSERLRLLDQFKNISASLQTRWDLNDFHSRHKKMEQLYSSGRISASLIIEGHRQVLENMTTRHELEREAFEALWNLHYLSGNIFEGQPQ